MACANGLTRRITPVVCRNSLITTLRGNLLRSGWRKEYLTCNGKRKKRNTASPISNKSNRSYSSYRPYIHLIEAPGLLRFGILLLALFAGNATLPGLVPVHSQGKQAATYYPARGDGWQQRRPEDVGMDGALLEQAVAYAKSQASTGPADFSTQVETFGRLLGPLPKMRGDSNGIILRHGYIVAEWGDTERIDPTYSVAKSFLSTLVGLAVDRGLIKNVRDPMKLYATDGGYDSPHNGKITWEQHLQQTSEWQGSMWEKNSNFLGVQEFGRGQRR